MMLQNASIYRNLLLSFFSLLFFSFLPTDSLQLYQARIRMSFGKPEFTTEVYVFTNWSSFDCRSFNQSLKKLAPEIIKDNRLYFIDLPSKENEKLSLINQYFLLKNKLELQKYLDIRDLLFSLAAEKHASNEEEIQKVFSEKDIPYQFLDKESAHVSQTLFSSLIKNFEIGQTPTIFIYNLKNNQRQKISIIQNLDEKVFFRHLESIQKNSPTKI